MNFIIDSIKKIYSCENRNKHLILFILVAVFTTLSSIYDIKTGQPDTWKQNPFDWTLNMLVAIYSIHFLHDCFAVQDKAELPFWSELKAKPIWGLIGLNIIWSFYFLIAVFIGVMWFAITNDWILPGIMCLIAIILLPFVYYCFIEYAKDFSLKGILRPDVLAKYISAAFKPTLKVYLLYILVFIILFIIYFVIYFVGSLAGITEILPIAKNYFFFDFIVSAFFEYFLNILLFFIFPYSLMQIYKKIIESKVTEQTEE